MSKFQRVMAARWVKSLWLVALLLALTLGQRAGHAAEMRFALVIGNDEYKSTKLATPANDAGLVANALTAAGFTVTGARNLDQATLRESVREFLGQVAAAGPGDRGAVDEVGDVTHGGAFRPPLFFAQTRPRRKTPGAA